MDGNFADSLDAGRMYAIAFDLDTDRLKTTYAGSSWNNAYNDIRAILENHGFDWMQGSLYFGKKHVDPVLVVVAVQDLTRRLPWFASSVRDIRLLRIEERSDLMPAIRATTEAQGVLFKKDGRDT